MRSYRQLEILMCQPDHFTVSYSINYWMDVKNPVHHSTAMQQWQTLKKLYESLGHRVHVMKDAKNVPDMVFTANAGIVYHKKALVSRFKSSYRQPEEPYFAQWFKQAGYQRVFPVCINEGEGDFLWSGKEFIGGTGFRTVPGAEIETAKLLNVRTVSLSLIDPRWYHLDTAMQVLDHQTVAFVPEGFSKESLEWLRKRFAQTIEVSVQDAEKLALNCVSDGKNVVVAQGAQHYHQQLEAAGFIPHPVEMSEFLKSGGGIKCCTLILNHQ